MKDEEVKIKMRVRKENKGCIHELLVNGEVNITEIGFEREDPLINVLFPKGNPYIWLSDHF